MIFLYDLQFYSLTIITLLQTVLYTFTVVVYCFWVIILIFCTCAMKIQTFPLVHDITVVLFVPFSKYLGVNTIVCECGIYTVPQKQFGLLEIKVDQVSPHHIVFSRYSLCGSTIIIMVEMKSYCEAGVSMQQVWVEGGLTLCFYFTLVPSVLLTLSFLFGTFLCVCYRPLRHSHGAQVHPPRSRLYRLQVGLSCCSSCWLWAGWCFEFARRRRAAGVRGCVRLSLHAGRDMGRGSAVSGEEEGSGAGQNQRTQYGNCCCTGLQRLAAENLAFVSWMSPQWWWTLETSDQQVSVCVICLCYGNFHMVICCINIRKGDFFLPCLSSTKWKVMAYLSLTSFILNYVKLRPAGLFYFFKYFFYVLCIVLSSIPVP